MFVFEVLFCRIINVIREKFLNKFSPYIIIFLNRMYRIFFSSDNRMLSLEDNIGSNFIIK